MDDIIKKINTQGIINKDDFQELAFSFCEEKGCSHLFRGITFDDTYRTIGAYRPPKKILIFNFDKVEDLAYKGGIAICNTYGASSKSLNYFFNFMFLYMIYHELRHIEQDYDRACGVNNNPVFSYLHDISVVTGRNQVSYNTYHDLYPIEIDAINYGYIYSYLKFIKADIPEKERQILLSQVYSNILRQYHFEGKKLVSPIEQFSDKVGCISLDYLSSIIKKSKIDSFDKLAHGLPVNKYEYRKLMVKENRLLKAINR